MRCVESLLFLRFMSFVLFSEYVSRCCHYLPLSGIVIVFAALHTRQKQDGVNARSARVDRRRFEISLLFQSLSALGSQSAKRSFSKSLQPLRLTQLDSSERKSLTIRALAEHRSKQHFSRLLVPSPSQARHAQERQIWVRPSLNRSRAATQEAATRPVTGRRTPLSTSSASQRTRQLLKLASNRSLTLSSARAASKSCVCVALVYERVSFGSGGLWGELTWALLDYRETISTT